MVTLFQLQKKYIGKSTLLRTSLTPTIAGYNLSLLISAKSHSDQVKHIIMLTLFFFLNISSSCWNSKIIVYIMALPIMYCICVVCTYDLRRSVDVFRSWRCYMVVWGIAICRLLNSGEWKHCEPVCILLEISSVMTCIEARVINRSKWFL